jgi:hypothetical protein
MSDVICQKLCGLLLDPVCGKLPYQGNWDTAPISPATGNLWLGGYIRIFKIEAKRKPSIKQAGNLAEERGDMFIRNIVRLSQE